MLQGIKIEAHVPDFYGISIILALIIIAREAFKKSFSHFLFSVERNFSKKFKIIIDILRFKDIYVIDGYKHHHAHFLQKSADNEYQHSLKTKSAGYFNFNKKGKSKQ